jgi:hypothetical protein
VPILRNVDIRNVTGAHIPILVKLTAGPTAVIENIQVTDCVFQGPDPVVLQQYPGKITFRNVTIPPPGAAP